jgi:tetratricopeptide (TPR) repeat protein
MNTLRGWLVWTAVITAAVSLPVVLAQDIPVRERAALWAQAVDGHVAGEPDAWVRQIAPWRLAALNSTLTLTLKQAQAVANESGPVLSGRLGRAAMFHADVAMMHREAGGYGAAGTGTASDVSVDGEVIGGSTRSAHWAFARRVLQERRRLFASEQEAAYSLLWYQTTAAFLQEWDDYTELVPHMEEAMRLHPRDAFLKTVQGAMHEYFAEPSIQRAVRAAHTAAMEAGSQQPGSNTGLIAGVVENPRTGAGSPGVRSVALERQTALKLFDDALQASPQHTEAAIRRANVLCRQDRADQAVRELPRALAGTKHVLLQYYGQLILGRCLLQLEQPLEANRAFGAAEVVFPQGQAPRLGRALASLLLGQPADDMSWMRQPTEADPWISYHRMHVPDVATLVQQLRASRQ